MNVVARSDIVGFCCTSLEIVGMKIVIFEDAKRSDEKAVKDERLMI
jgi:hypothetical protein